MLALLLVLGAVGGFALSRGLDGGAVVSGVAEPVVAASPSLPVDQGVVPHDDPTDAPLPSGVELTEATIGAGRSAITYPVPVGWKANHMSSNVVKWKKPKTSNNTYVMRVTDVRSRNQTIDEAIDTEIAEMRASEDGGFHLERRGDTSIEYTHVSTEGTLRHSFRGWVDLDEDGLADVDVVVHGREADVAGTSDLVGRVAEGMRRG